MKLLLKQELELRQQTRSELVQLPTSEMSSEQLPSRCAYLQSQMQHSFHITEQLSTALTEQLECIYAARRIIKQLQDELAYSKAYVKARIDAVQEDLSHVFESDIEFQKKKE